MKMLKFLRVENYVILGSLMLNLNEIPRGGKRVDECVLGVLVSSTKVNLFSATSYRAWWPITANDRYSDDKLIVVSLTFVIYFFL